ncbi:Pectin lyase fold/virulence factor [Pseudocohnilembus persalinus]|uniref:Pectin lyase fold/virulence factor n=1 Tax=Pseudocohnilembus persalinus TaxID=266149 RepID=A0A0V0Q904_PSEPJ|nr:Pectin lyase fold/virulence factor [Pseudocohnilembus persalinus]|eukprot:KRW98686.1 Pectin lyase fold/virulence factor [Pseudocohnilembus persalinus]
MQMMASQFGGGAQLQDIYKFDIINCNFENNLAGGLGGGIAVFNFTVGQIISSNFTNNQVSYSGGAIQLFDGEVFKIYDCNFDDNGGNAQTGGAIQTYEVNHISILDSIFQYNFCANSGGGIYIKYASEIFVERSTFYNNTAHNETLLQKQFYHVQ